MKTQRHAAILRIVRRDRVESQEQLRERLKSEGYEVTQATLSRDLRLLGLTKVANADGGSRYAAPPEVGSGIRPQLEQLLPTLLVSLDAVGPFLVLKTVTGAAQSLAQPVNHSSRPRVDAINRAFTRVPFFSTARQGAAAGGKDALRATAGWAA